MHCMCYYVFLSDKYIAMYHLVFSIDLLQAIVYIKCDQIFKNVYTMYTHVVVRQIK